MKPEARNATGLMIFAMLSSAVVLVIMGLFGVLVFGLVNQINQPVTTHPYDTLNRPTPPERIALNQLLPERLGTFQRQRLGGKLGSFQAIYGVGDEQIALSGARAVNFVAAQAMVKRVTGTGAGSR